jgi:cellulose synthase/poly-beta-1,6-N-acetylglucosamine synthase-like glycosyltransferase
MSPGVATSIAFEQGAPVTPEALRLQPEALDCAINGLCRADAELSASAPITRWQRCALLAIAALLPVMAWSIVTGHGGFLAAFLTLPFVVIVAIRIAAVWQVITPPPVAHHADHHIADCDLPTYSVLVPLFKEAGIVPALVQALNLIDYPRDKLEIIFATEEVDAPTQLALSHTDLASHMRVVVVPAGRPQTKPRALNYALQFATGALIAVYDAEDVPDPRQLRLAAAHFAASGTDLACVQARLAIHNTSAGFLMRQFTLEYAALFEAILPLLQRLGLPILLGGTSNHFRRSSLDEAGAWDPFNVTEDADLGVRLARFGKRVAMLDSDTWEEAPSTFRTWLGQRTRWLKGWMQTYLVHMRDPRRLVHDIGLWRFLGVQVMLGGMILSALVHPWFYAAGLSRLMLGLSILPDDGNLWWLSWFNLWAGYAAGIVLGLISAWRSQGRVHMLSAVLVPVYWLAISVASYRALWEFYARPFHWEKTPHAARLVTAAKPIP